MFEEVDVSILSDIPDDDRKPGLITVKALTFTNAYVAQNQLTLVECYVRVHSQISAPPGGYAGRPPRPGIHTPFFSKRCLICKSLPHSSFPSPCPFSSLPQGRPPAGSPGCVQRAKAQCRYCWSRARLG